MNNYSPITRFFTIIGFIVVFSFVMRILGGIFFFSLKFIIPIVFIMWVIRAVRGDNHNRYNRYR